MLAWMVLYCSVRSLNGMGKRRADYVSSYCLNKG